MFTRETYLRRHVKYGLARGWSLLSVKGRVSHFRIFFVLLPGKQVLSQFPPLKPGILKIRK